MRAHSLRIRLLLLSALGIALALTVAGVVLAGLFEQHLNAAQVIGLTSELNRLVALIDADEPVPKLSQPMADPRFALPLGGIYWQVTDPTTGVAAHSRSVWEGRLVLSGLPAGAPEPVAKRIIDPAGLAATAVGRRLSFGLSSGTTRLLDVVVAEDLSGTEAAIANYRLSLGLALAVLGLALIGAAALQVTAGLAPLKTIKSGIASIRRGETTKLSGDFPSEIEPLVQEVNDLAEAHERSVGFARERAADLAHGLRTHLQVLTAEAHRVRLKGDEASAKAIDQLTAEMTGTIDHQLGLARLRGRSPHSAGLTEIETLVQKVVATVRRTERGRDLDWHVDIQTGAAASIDPSDLLDLAGILLDNAVKWARQEALITCRVDRDTLILSVEDDGPGLQPAQISQLGTRGLRLDEARSGSGIGLSIASEIVDINQGSIAFSVSELGGLKVSVELRTNLESKV